MSDEQDTTDDSPPRITHQVFPSAESEVDPEPAEGGEAEAAPTADTPDEDENQDEA